MRRKKQPRKAIENVPTASMSKKFEVLAGNAALDTVEKRKALRPNADNGNAVAVPRWFGQFMAAGEV